MAEENDNENAAKDRAAELSRKLDEMMHGHKTKTDEEMAKIRAEVKDALADLDRADKAEKEELRNQLAELIEWKKAEDKAREERDKVKSSSATMVVPPSDVKVEQPIQPSDTQPVDEDGGQRKGSWARFW